MCARTIASQSPCFKPSDAQTLSSLCLVPLRGQGMCATAATDPLLLVRLLSVVAVTVVNSDVLASLGSSMQLLPRFMVFLWENSF